MQNNQVQFDRTKVLEECNINTTIEDYRASQTRVGLHANHASIMNTHHFLPSSAIDITWLKLNTFMKKSRTLSGAMSQTQVAPRSELNALLPATTDVAAGIGQAGSVAEATRMTAFITQSVEGV